MKLKVLVVDDDDMLREELSEFLIDKGNFVCSAESGEVAIQRIEDEDFDLILTDLKMPGMDGLEVLKKTKAIKPNTPVIMITGYASVETAINAMKLGALDYIQKPFEPKQLIKVMEGVEDEIEYKSKVKLLENFIKIEKHDSYDQFKDLSQRMPGMCIIAREPEEFLAEFDLENVEIIWLATEGMGKFDDEVNAEMKGCRDQVTIVTPRDLYKLKCIITSFLNENRECTVLIEGLGVLVERHTPENMKRFISEVSKSVSPDSHMIIIMDKEKLNENTMLELKELVGSISLQAITDSLANPMRRGIVRVLAKQPHSNFSNIMKALHTKDTPKLSFHIKKLNNESILNKDENRFYSLTDRGYIAAKYLERIEADSVRNLQENISLVLD